MRWNILFPLILCIHRTPICGLFLVSARFVFCSFAVAVPTTCNTLSLDIIIFLFHIMKLFWLPAQNCFLQLSFYVMLVPAQPRVSDSAGFPLTFCALQICLLICFFLNWYKTTYKARLNYSLLQTENMTLVLTLTCKVAKTLKTANFTVCDKVGMQKQSLLKEDLNLLIKRVSA